MAVLALVACDEDALQQAHGDLAAEPAILDFGAVAEGRSGRQSVVLTNPGSLPVVVTAKLGADGSADFAVGAVSLTLTPREIASVDVTFTPVGSGTDTGTLVLTTDDEAIAPVTVALRGGPIAARLDVTPNPLDFAPAEAATSTRTLMIANGGAANLSVTVVGLEVSANPDFDSTAPALPALLVPGAEVSMTVRYFRSSRTDTGVLVIRSDAGEVQVQLLPDPLAACEDGADNDGDGLVDFPQDPGCEQASDDDEFNLPECAPGSEGPCGSGVGACRQGTRRCMNGVWGACQGATDAIDEVCDGVDNDCDNRVDEELIETCTINGCAGARACVESSTVPTGLWRGCVPLAATQEMCNGADDDCNGIIDDAITLVCVINGCAGTQACLPGGSGQLSDCRPTNASAEVCNGLDDNCSGVPDDGLGVVTCGAGVCTATAAACVNGVPGNCVPGPMSAEVCNGLDDNCDGVEDDGLGSISCGIGACTATAAACVGGMAGTCVPGMDSPEVCNGLDDDCNGADDDGLGIISCGRGACTATVAACAGGLPGVCTPGSERPEVCNGEDDDCNGVDDDGLIQLLAPVSGSMVGSLAPRLSWNAPVAGHTYTVQLSESPALSPGHAGYPVVGSSPHQVAPLLADGATYYWRIDGARTSNACTFSSTVASFTTSACGYAIALSAPAGGATVNDDTPQLSWSAGAGDACTSSLWDDTGVAVPGYPLAATSPHDVATQLADGDYRWRVDCVEAGTGCAATAPVGAPGYRTFTVQTACNVATPLLLAPADGVAWLGGPRLSWAGLGTASTLYTLQIDEDPGFSAPTVHTTMSEAAHVVNEVNLPLTAGTTYHWRVRGNDGNCDGPWSAQRSFTVEVLYSRANCSGPSESSTYGLLGGGLFGFSYAGQLEYVGSGPLAQKIIIPITDSDGLFTVQSNVRCLESVGLGPCTSGPGSVFAQNLGTDLNTNVPGATADEAGTIYVSASNALDRAIYRYDASGTSLGATPVFQFYAGLAYDDGGASPQILTQVTGASSIHSLSTAGVLNWSAATGGLVNTDIEVDASRGRIFQSVQGGVVDVFEHAGPAGPPPARSFSVTTLQPRLTFSDPVGLGGYVGPASNRSFIAVSDYADPGGVVFLHIGANAAASYPVLKVTDADLRYSVGMDADPVTGDIFVITHPTGGNLRFTGFRVLRFCPTP